MSRLFNILDVYLMAVIAHFSCSVDLCKFVFGHDPFEGDYRRDGLVDCAHLEQQGIVHVPRVVIRKVRVINHRPVVKEHHHLLLLVPVRGLMHKALREVKVVHFVRLQVEWYVKTLVYIRLLFHVRELDLFI